MVAALRPLGVAFCARVRGAATAEVEEYLAGKFEARFKARIALRAGCDRSILKIEWGDNEQKEVKEWEVIERDVFSTIFVGYAFPIQLQLGGLGEWCYFLWYGGLIIISTIPQSQVWWCESHQD